MQQAFIRYVVRVRTVLNCTPGRNLVTRQRVNLDELCLNVRRASIYLAFGVLFPQRCVRRRHISDGLGTTHFPDKMGRAEAIFTGLTVRGKEIRGGKIFGSALGAVESVIAPSPKH